MGTPTPIPAFAAGVIEFDSFELGDVVTTGELVVEAGPALLVPKDAVEVSEYVNETLTAMVSISVSVSVAARKVVVHLHKLS